MTNIYDVDSTLEDKKIHALNKIQHSLNFIQLLLLSILIVLLLYGLSEAETKTIALSSLNRTVDLGCKWDKQIDSVQVFGYYLTTGVNDMFTSEELFPQKYAVSGSRIYLVFDESAYMYNGKKLSHIVIEFTTVNYNC